ncbi:unnamed protein product [Lactuca saligna]|uniref:Uncharacterized protein n=1 Tax=Lactuca saligna TaxID=75948 RepID=A0AA36E9A0_LACSI|nr:unnamed protein product [Lactuca saligna]
MKTWLLKKKSWIKLAVKIGKVKVLSVKLNHANKRIKDLLSEKAAMKSCIADLNAYTNNFIETHNSLITISVRKHLIDKIRPVFAMLNRIEGVSESGTLPKLGGYRENLSSKETSKPAVLDENPRIAREAEEKEKELRDDQITLEATRLLFPPWFMERILTKATGNPHIHWLESVTSFGLENTMDSQLDFPITPKPFLFCIFEGIANASDLDENVNKSLMAFYMKHGKPQYQT